MVNYFINPTKVPLEKQKRNVINSNNTFGCASKILAILNAVEFCCCTRRCNVFMPRMIKYAAFCQRKQNKHYYPQT